MWLLRWYRLVAFQTCTGTFRHFLKALQRVSAFSGETSGLAAKAIQRNAVCSAWRKMELQFEHPCLLISLLCPKRFHEFQHRLLLNTDPRQCVYFGCSWECCVWLCVPGPEKWMFLAPGTLLHVTGSLYPSAVADLPSFLTRLSCNI